MVETGPYFSINYPETPEITSLPEAIETVTPLLKLAVKRQSVSDVPIGCFLSGGIDSSSMVALLQQQSSQPIQTFNVKFETEGYDESPIARAVAAHCSTDHHEVVLPNFEFEESIFWEIIERMGQPFRDSSAIPTYLVSKKIREHVKVAISGDGGDELFGGYALFQWYTKILKLQRIPEFARSVAGGATSLMQEVGMGGVDRLRQISRAVQTAKLGADDVAIALNEQFTEAEISELLPDHNSNHYPRLKTYPETAASWSPLRKIMYYRGAYTLPSNMLVKVDRMSMANSLEVRAPFLDHELFSASTLLADDLLVNGGVGKFALREAMKPHLPAAVFDHPKQGFNLPLHHYRNEAFRALAHRLLFDENPAPNLFPKAVLERIYKQGTTLTKDTATMSVFRASHQLWMMMMLFGWIKRFNVQAA